MPEAFDLGPKNSVELVDGALIDASAATDLTAAVGAIDASPKERPLVVHFHGGLVGKSSAAGMAAGLGPVYAAAGGIPFFFVWRSDAWTVITKNFTEIAKETAFKLILQKAGRWLASKLGDDPTGAKGVMTPVPAGTVPDEPEALRDFLEPIGERARATGVRDLTKIDQKLIEQDLEKDLELTKMSVSIADGLRTPAELGVAVADRGFGVRQSTATAMSKEAMDELRSTLDPGGAKGFFTTAFLAKKVFAIVKSVISRFVRRRDHGLYTTLVEETLRLLYVDVIGRAVWGAMKKDTADAFLPGRGGDLFVRAISKAWTPGRRLVLVGHSTGAVYISHFLSHLHAVAPTFAGKADVVFLAAACTFEHLAEHKPAYDAHARSIRTFALKDEIERSYWEAPGYRGSLLYMVSGLFEPEVDAPIVGMERYWRGAAPYDGASVTSVLQWIGPTQRIWGTTDAAAALGTRTTAAKHGDFDEDPACRESLAHLIANG